MSLQIRLWIQKCLLRNSNIFTLAGLKHDLFLEYVLQLWKANVQMQRYFSPCSHVSVSSIEWHQFQYSMPPPQNLVSAVLIPGTWYPQHYWAVSARGSQAMPVCNTVNQLLTRSTELTGWSRHTYGAHISCCQAVTKFCKDYKSHTVPARRDCIFIIALPWGHINAPLEFTILKH